MRRPAPDVGRHRQSPRDNLARTRRVEIDQSRDIGDRFHVADPSIEGNFVYVPIRQAVAAGIIPDQCVICRQPT